jgi:hypothetical protein
MVSRKSTLVKAGGVAVGAGLFLAVLLIALLEVLGRARREQAEVVGRSRHERAEAAAGMAPSFFYRSDDRDGVPRTLTDGSESAGVRPPLGSRDQSRGRRPDPVEPYRGRRE